MGWSRKAATSAAGRPRDVNVRRDHPFNLGRTGALRDHLANLAEYRICHFLAPMPDTSQTVQGVARPFTHTKPKARLTNPASRMSRSNSSSTASARVMHDRTSPRFRSVREDIRCNLSVTGIVRCAIIKQQRFPHEQPSHFCRN